ncbi:MAG: hypothetical protein ISS63_10465 [Desulfobacteraceae bacterium]|nr:hypothetical protein [Desulfobacteraceae bacterium]
MAGWNAGPAPSIRKRPKTAWIISRRSQQRWGSPYRMPFWMTVQHRKISLNVFPTRIRQSAAERIGTMPTRIVVTVATRTMTVRLSILCAMASSTLIPPGRSHVPAGSNILKRYPKNRPEAARALGMSRTTLWRKMKRYGLLE